MAILLGLPVRDVLGKKCFGHLSKVERFFDTINRTVDLTPQASESLNFSVTINGQRQRIFT